MNDLKEILYNQSKEFSEIVDGLNYDQRKILIKILHGYFYISPIMYWRNNE